MCSRCTVGILSDYGWIDIRDLRDGSDGNRQREVGWLGAESDKSPAKFLVKREDSA